MGETGAGLRRLPARARFSGMAIHRCSVGVSSMAGIYYSDEVAARLEDVYLVPDIAAQRAHTLGRLALRPGEAVLDIGSGPGFLCIQMAEAVGPSGRVKGIDISPQMVARARARTDHSWVEYAEGDATALPEADGSYDVVVSTQVAEYLADIGEFCTELRRILRPGGRGLVLATDWEAIAWYSDEPERMERMMRAFQPHCADSRLPRTLGPRLREAGLTVTGVSAFPIVNADGREDCYSRKAIHFQADFLRLQDGVAEEEVGAWLAEQDRLAAEDRYFFASNRFIFEFARPLGG